MYNHGVDILYIYMYSYTYTRLKLHLDLIFLLEKTNRNVTETTDLGINTVLYNFVKSISNKKII